MEAFYSEPAELAAGVVAIAQAAARRIMEIYDGPVTATQKADGSPLTQADLAAQEEIVSGLAALLPLPVHSEEAPVTAAERRTWPSYWLVDPLDGTREFIERNGEFTVNIALMNERRPVLGVVCAPALDLTYWATLGGGAYVRRGGGPAVVAKTRIPEGPLRVAVSRSHGGDALPAFLERLGPSEPVPMGSSLKICLVADGTADLYPRLGPTSEWDIAAAHIVLTEAGGTLTSVDGSPLEYNKEDVLNPWFLAAGSTHVQGVAVNAAAVSPARLA
jgi:3'(2'), 5'-bisphosphate nucleotidase